MDCLEFRRLLASDPHSTDAPFIAHHRECARCADAYSRAIVFENHLRSALNIAAPPQLAETILFAQATRERGQRLRWRNGGIAALAASIALAIGIGTHAGASPLPDLAIEHLREEAAVLTTVAPVASDDVRRAFATRGIELHSIPADVSFVGCCPMGRHLTVHLVMPGNEGPVTVIYVVDDHESVRQDFIRDGWHGRSVPVGKGTLVLLSQNTNQLDHAETVWRDALTAS